ncbi:unnamed protein product [Durusdinium trenchii]|uniref:Uncharacterized protein n=1 Tax=Durusdinium trenchii TaxID=1381693 RepID=A0ABP0P1M9_9DINO|eukprot:g107.t1
MPDADEVSAAPQVDTRAESAGSQHAREAQEVLQEMLKQIQAHSAALHSDVASVRRHYSAASQAVSKVRLEALSGPKSGRVGSKSGRLSLGESSG